jgi:hypothetical protein
MLCFAFLYARTRLDLQEKMIEAPYVSRDTSPAGRQAVPDDVFSMRGWQTA